MTAELRAALDKLIRLIERQELSGLITRDLIRAKDELRVAIGRANR